MKKIFALALAGLLLVGCSSSAPTTKTCSMSDGSDSVVINGAGDTVESISETFTMDISDYDEATQQTMMDSASSAYDGFNGVTYDASLDNGIVSITVTVDLKTASHDDLVTLGLASAGDTGNYSVEATVDNFEAQGYTCE